MDTNPRAVKAGLAGVIGSVLFFAGWALALKDPAVGSTAWYVGGTIGWIAGIGFAALLSGMLLTRETGRNVIGRIALTAWLVGTLLISVAGIIMLAIKSTDIVLFPIGGIMAGVMGLVASIFIAANRSLNGLRRWAPLAYAVGGFVTGLFQGEHHTLQVNLADLANALLTLLLAVAFYRGLATDPRPATPAVA